jgi:putative transposase
MRQTQIAPGENYHIFNRGNNKQLIFIDDHDRMRFLFLALFFQAPLHFPNIARQSSTFYKNLSAKNIEHDVEHSVFNGLDKEVRFVNKEKYIELGGFVLMPNHFHMIVSEIHDKGMSRYMQRVLNSYTKYFNAKYGKSGHLFQGPYGAVHIKNNEQLLYLSAYIHRNPRELKEWHNKEHQYMWSSYRDYINVNRWEPLLKTDLIISQFRNNKEYIRFVETSGAKNEELEKMFSD